MRLRNELTQKAIARECADWIREKVRFRTNMTDGAVTPFVAVIDEASYAPVTEFITVGFGAERGNTMMNFVLKQDAAESRFHLSDSETARFSPNPLRGNAFLRYHSLRNEIVGVIKKVHRKYKRK